MRYGYVVKRTPFFLLFVVSFCWIACRGGNTVEQDGQVDGGAKDTDSIVDQQTDIVLGDPVELSIATFNVENLFDSEDDPLHDDTVVSATALSAKIKEVGKALRRLDGDILALQEVETLDLLERLNTQELNSRYVDIAFIVGNDIRGANVALLSRYPIIDIKSHVQETFKGVDDPQNTYGFSRDCLEVTVEPSAGRTLKLLVNHFRAKVGGDSGEQQRYAQAKRVREIANAILSKNADANVAIVGDLNDTPSSRTLQILHAGTPELYDVLDAVPQAQRYTTIFSGDKEQIDYILVSPGLKGDLISGSATIDHDDIYSDTSDHFPVKARFIVR